MATSAKRFPFLLLMFALLSSRQSDARESYFFNKATTSTAPTNNNNNSNEKEMVEVMPNNSKEEQDPNFIPDNQSGYGLYGHDSGHLPKTTTDPTYTTTNLPQKTGSSGPYATENYNTNYKETYVTDPQGMSDTRFMESGYTTPTAATVTGEAYTTNNLPYETESEEYYPTTMYNNNNNNYNNNNNNNNNNKEPYVTDPQGMSDRRSMDRGYNSIPAATAAAKTNNYNYYHNGVNYNHNTQQQGMSDTRFLENGRYYYDINSEEKYRNENGKWRGVNYNNMGYYENYNNDNSYENNNSMEGYQNPEDRFNEAEEEYVP